MSDDKYDPSDVPLLAVVVLLVGGGLVAGVVTFAIHWLDLL